MNDDADGDDGDDDDDDGDDDGGSWMMGDERNFGFTRKPNH